MIKEIFSKKKKRAAEIIKRLKKIYPESQCALLFASAWELLVATILSAQCTDKRVNLVTPALFRDFPTVEDFAAASIKNIETKIKPTGFYKNKAKHIKNAAQIIVSNFNSEVPQTMEELITLPGVGRKTANVVLGNAFGIPSMPVDTHMIRLNNLLNLTDSKKPEKIEKDLMALVPQKDWTIYSHLIISHGRTCCVARRPRCEKCVLSNLCLASKSMC